METLTQVQAYFQAHHQHIRYQHFEDRHFPLGSDPGTLAGQGDRLGQSGSTHRSFLHITKSP